MSDVPFGALRKMMQNGMSSAALHPNQQLLSVDPTAVDGGKKSEMDHYVQQRTAEVHANAYDDEYDVNDDVIEDAADHDDGSAMITTTTTVMDEAPPSVAPVSALIAAPTIRRRANEAVIEFQFDPSDVEAPPAAMLDSNQLKHVFGDAEGQLNLGAKHTVSWLRITQVHTNSLVPLALHVRNVAGPNTSVAIQQRRGKAAHAFTIEAKANGAVRPEHSVLYHHEAAGVSDKWLAKFDAEKEFTSPNLVFTKNAKDEHVAQVLGDSDFGQHLFHNSTSIFNGFQIAKARPLYKDGKPTLVLPAQAVRDQMDAIRTARSKRLPSTDLGDITFALERYTADDKGFAHGSASANTKGVMRTVSIHIAGELHKPEN